MALADLEAAERVKRCIVEPVAKRWQKPKSADQDALIGDYISDLREFDEATLNAAFDTVRREHEYASWPVAAKFRKAAQELRPREPESPGSNETAFLAQCRRQATARTMELVNSQKYVEAGFWKDGLFSVAKREIEDRIYYDLQRGGDGDPNVTQGDMTRWREAAERIRNGAAPIARGFKQVGQAAE